MAGKRKNVTGWVDAAIVCYCLSALGHLGVVFAIVGYYVHFLSGDVALAIFFPALSMAGVFCLISVGMIVFSRNVRHSVSETLKTPTGPIDTQ